MISEYGASIWCDPYKWIPEAHRLLRPGGYLRFYRGSVLTQLCSPTIPMRPVGTELIRDHFGLYRIDWGDGRRRVHLAPRRDDPAADRDRVRDRGTGRNPGPGRRHHPLPVHDCRMGQPLALRRSLESPQALVQSSYTTEPSTSAAARGSIMSDTDQIPADRRRSGQGLVQHRRRSPLAAAAAASSRHAPADRSG